jgi:hypothetical protein
MEEPCSICMEPIIKAGMELECGHRFHSKCGVEWLKKHNSCPLCRGKVCDEKDKSIQQIIHDAIAAGAHQEDGFVIAPPHLRRVTSQYTCYECQTIFAPVYRLDDGGYACNSHCFTCDTCNKLYMLANRWDWRSNTCYTCAGGD